MADRVGRQFGNYRLIRLLGRGGFAEVYLGEHIYLETQAAIKVLHTQLATTDIEQFRIEARTIARLEHPHIVRVLEFGVEDSTPFLVMSYAPNGTLRQRHPKSIALPLTTVISYIKEIAPALHYAHEQKLIHRDIKPENLLLGRANEILLSDFGIALVAQSSNYQSTKDMAGTIAYMAPEQIEAHPRPASDQYSLGIVVYEWLSGDRPFHGTFTEIAIKHSVTPPPPLRQRVPTISPTVEQVVLTALAKDPRDRFATVQAFSNALEQASQVRVDETIPASRPEQLSKTQPAFSPPFPPTEIATPPIIPQPPKISESVVGSANKSVNLVPLGLVAFAISAFLLGALNTNLITGFAAIGYLFAICGLIQIISGIQELRRGNNFTTTVLCSYGAYWLSFGFLLMPLFSSRTLLDLIGFRYLATALGVFLLSWTIFTGLMLLCALRSFRAFIALFASIFLSLLIFAIGELKGFDSAFFQTSGWIEYLTALIGAITTWYVVTHRSALEAVFPAKVNPIPLGLSAFALTAFVISLANAGIFTGFAVALGLFLFYGGLIEIIAGIQALVNGNSFAATAFCANGGLWFVLGFIITPGFSGRSLVDQSTNPSTVIGILLLGWTIANLITTVLARKTSIALIVVFLVASVTFLFLAIGALSGSNGMTQFGGWLGIITAILAWYTMLALLLAEAKKPLKLPHGPRS